MDPKEVLNMAYQEEIEIESTTKIPDIHLLEADIRGMRPLQTAKVPLYIALTLKNSKMCRIRLPSYFRRERLEETVDAEKENVSEYTKLHRHFFELSSILISNAYDAENPENLRLLVQEIKELRLQKTLDGMKLIDGHAFNVNNLTMWEFSEVRPFILSTSETARCLLKKDPEQPNDFT